MPNDLELDGVENDDPTKPAEPVTPRTTRQRVKTNPKDADVPYGSDVNDDIDIAAALAAGGMTKPKTDPKPAAEPEADPEPEPEIDPETNPEPVVEPDPATDPAPDPGKEPEKPAVDVEAQIEARLAAKLAEKEAELRQRYEADKQRAIDAVAKRYLSKEDSAVKKLRDLEAARGMSVDQIMERDRESEIQRLQVDEGFTAEAARKFVMAQEESALYKAREADRQREHAEQKAETEYNRDRLSWTTAPDTDDFDKRMYAKFADEIDSFANHGKPQENGGVIKFEVARDYILGQHRKEIQAEIRKEAEAEKARLKAEADVRERAAEQRAIRNIQNRGNQAPETGTQGVAQKSPLLPGTSAMAKAMDIDPRAIAKTKLEKAKRRT